MVDVELVGNALCLDFTNTVNVRPQPARDWLDSAEQAETWARAVGQDAHASQISRQALEAARTLRETLYGIFEALTRAARPEPQHLEALLHAQADAVRTAELAPAPEGFRLTWPADGSITPLVNEITDSAVTLLTHGPLERLGQCPSCGWLFLDTSKNGRRRWCSMTTCGARDKARRHYRSQHAESHSTTSVAPPR
jgi:predicted RNA-binding Zn ribbon-like protein